MRRRYTIASILMFIAVVYILVTMIIDKNRSGALEDDTEQFDENAIIDEESVLDGQGLEKLDAVNYEQPEWILRGIAVKMVALALEDKQVVQVKEREIDFSDSSKEDWFDKYFNVGIVTGWYSAPTEQLNPLDSLTYSELEGMLTFFSLSLEMVGVNEGVEKGSPVSYQDWLIAYEFIVATREEAERPQECILYVFATPTISNELEAWSMATDKGIYYFEGLQVDGCINKKINAVVKGKDILYVKEIIEENPVLTNAYIEKLNADDYVADVFMGGVTRTIQVDKELAIIEEEGFVADIKLVDNQITAITKKEESTHGIVKMITDTQVDLEGTGKVTISEDAKVYNLVGDISFSNHLALLVGYDTATFVLDQYEVVAILITKEVEIGNIRVAINTTGFAGLVHDDVTLTSNKLFTLLQGDEEQECEANEVLKISELKLDIGDRVIIKPSEGNKLQIASINRGAASSTFNPEYRGIIEVERVDGGYHIINELDFEEYLYSVVPSEMPTAYGLEAAKVQAICARSYGYSQILANRFCEYGAHVDDSVTCQVYNNISETEQSINAVDLTKGLLLSYQGNIISANFFSTSCGMTSDSGDVWANYETKEFPTTSSLYLQSKYQFDEILEGDLSDEETFRAFITDKYVPSYEAEFPWYRWSTKMTGKQIEAAINKMIQSRYIAQPKLIKTLDENNVFRSRMIESIGELQDLYVYSRGSSGIITEVIIKSSTGVYKIATEYNIRALIAPVNYVDGEDSIILTKKDGSTTKEMSMMPSAFYVMDKIYNENGKLDEVFFHGGGYGHGVGMSQNGVKALVDLGYTYEDILSHYYEGTELIKMD